MKKEHIDKIRIDVISIGENTLSMLLDREGRISRQGSGTLPVDEFGVVSNNDGSFVITLR